MTHGGRWVRASVAIVCSLGAFGLAMHPSGVDGVEPPVEDSYWKLGVGSYGLHDGLDGARFDWLYLCYGNISATRETTERINRLLEINPRLKVLIRVWPIMSKGDCQQNRHQATMWHYLYKPGVKEKVLEEIDRQIHVVLDHIARPENVIGSTFLEELPAHFSAVPMSKNTELGWAMERFRKEIEAERGKPLVWDDDMRRWWGTKWVQVMEEIHAAMKKSSGNRRVFYYQMTTFKSLDMVPQDTPLSTPMLMPVSWKDIIKPGLCDGFFAYPNNTVVWNRYLKLAKENGWLFFSQVSHPSGMRLSPWDECVRLAKTRVPHNLGYFFFCGGECAASNAWNDDPGIPPGPKWNTRGPSTKLHIRRHLALEDVGMDIVRHQPPLRLSVDLPLDDAAAGEFMHARVIVENTREPSFYLDPKDAVARNATVTLTLPPGFYLDPSHSATATLKLGDLAAGQFCVGDWWVSVKKDFGGKITTPFVFTGRADKSPPAVVETAKDAAVAFGQPHEIGIPGTMWKEAAYRLPPGRGDGPPRVVIEGLAGPVRQPAVGDQFNTIRYDGVIEAGMKLVLDPRDGARLFTEPIVADDGKARADATDPNGYKPFDDGYMVLRYGSRARVDAKMPLKVSLSGKSEEDGNCHVILRFRMRKAGVTKDMGVLTNRFNNTWRTVTAMVTPPDGAVSLENVFVYRFQSKGKVWFGPITVVRADADPSGVDVTSRLRGSYPSLSRWHVHEYHYTDDNPPSLRPRVRVRLEVPKQE